MPASHEKRRILIVANRLPVSIKRNGSEVELIPSSGGLATGLSSLPQHYQTAWIGWPGVARKDERKDIESRLISKYEYYPVFLQENISEKYYEGYSNRTIWPIFHSFPSNAKYTAAEWEAYKKANQQFCSKVLEIYQPGDVIWVHDYHLLLLPQYLRDKLPNAVIGFFLHIPFPHYDIFRLLPRHQEMIQHMLGADLLGFHTHDYVQAFLGSARRVLGHDNSLGQMMIGTRIVQADVFPMGIDYEKYAAAPHDEAMSVEIGKMRNRLKSRKTALMVSRLDYTKGIPESLEGIREFFERHPEWHEKIIFFLVVVPSREKVERYASLKREIDELIGNINSSFGTLYWIPVGYIYRSLTFGELIGLYSCADIALVTPLRDGMNLVTKEYLAVKNGGKGVLILSEMAGASKELLEAIIVNPNSKEDIAEAIFNALSMPEDEQIRRNRVMKERLRTHDIKDWVQRFFKRLEDVGETSATLAVKMLDGAARNGLLQDFKKAQTKMIVTDYDGTLVPFAKSPDDAVPDKELVDLIDHLANIEGVQIVIISGRDRRTLQEWFGSKHLTLVAEHGGWMKNHTDAEWTPTLTPAEDTWKKEIRPIMELFLNRIPESFIEEKTFSLVWHFRNAESESAAFAARELLDTLANFTMNLSIQVVPGDKTVEVRTGGIGKGVFYSRFLANTNPSFILAMGDDWTDEDLFAVLPSNAYSIKVGLRTSKAKYNLKSYQEVRALLHQLAK